MVRKEREFYPITSVCKDDIIRAFGDDDKKTKRKVRARLKKMTKDEMIYLAEKLADDYCNQLYWDSLRYIFKDKFLRQRETRNGKRR
jgi:hypothetical protein